MWIIERSKQAAERGEQWTKADHEQLVRSMQHLEHTWHQVVRHREEQAIQALRLSFGMSALPSLSERQQEVGR